MSDSARTALIQEALDLSLMHRDWAAQKHELPRVQHRNVAFGKAPTATDSSTSTTTTSNRAETTGSSQATADQSRPVITPVNDVYEPDMKSSNVPTWAKAAGIGAIVTGPLLGAAALYQALKPQPAPPANTNTTIQQKGPEYGDLLRFLGERGYDVDGGSGSDPQAGPGPGR